MSKTARVLEIVRPHLAVVFPHVSRTQRGLFGKCVMFSDAIVARVKPDFPVRCVPGDWVGPVTNTRWLREGYYKRIGHIWVELQIDGKVWWVDPTARQFHGRMPFPLVTRPGRSAYLRA